ncbi:MAG TPA: hypothetical protein VN496_00460 [Burkholderiales bacterium]|nr:hypothetical protein [Burkholderiales bacterium]
MSGKSPMFPESETRPVLQVGCVELDRRSLIDEVRSLRAAVERLYLRVKHQSHQAEDLLEVVMELAAVEFARECERWRTWMLSQNRSEPKVTARMVAMKLCVEVLGWGKNYTGRRFKHDRGTVMNACRSIGRRCDVDDRFFKRYQAVAAKARALLPELK